jgi:hypothetical protein
VPRARLLDSEPFSCAKAEVAVGARAGPGSAKSRHDYRRVSTRLSQTVQLDGCSPSLPLGKSERYDLAMAVGDISPDEVRARWAYSELLSGRYEHVKGIEHLLEKARRHVLFADLASDDHKELERAWHGGRSGLLPAFNNIQAFQEARWGHMELAQVRVIPYFAQDVVSASIANAASISFRTWIQTEPIRPLPQGHARFAIYEPLPHGEVKPLTVGLDGGQRTLLDGYHRAVRFWYRRAIEPTATLSVFIPR